MAGRGEGAATAALAAAVGIAAAMVIDLGAPRTRDGRLATTASSALPARSLAERMEAQIAAGAPGVAMAIEKAAAPAERDGAAVAAAHARALFELGNAPEALTTVRTAVRICQVTSACSWGETAYLGRLESVFAAVVGAGVVDPKSDPAKVEQALHGLLRPAMFAR